MARYGGPRVEAALRDPSYLTVANIIGIRNFNSNNDVDAVEDYLAKNGDPYQNQLDAANQALKDQQNRFIQQLEEVTIQQAAQQAAGAQAVEELTLQLQQNQEANDASLQAQLSQQQAQFDQQIAFQQQQAAAAEARAREQARIARNQANAFTPAPNPTAQSVAAGDDREELFATPTSKKKKTEADDLSIISGVGTQGNPLAGLQIA
mgnify:CR=1 FL=1